MQPYRGCKARGTADGAEVSSRRCSSAFAGSPEEVTAAAWVDTGGFLGLDRMRLGRCGHCWMALLLWLLMWLVLSFWILLSMSSQATAKREEALASMCDERAQMLQDKVSATMSRLQSLAILVSTFHHSKNPSAMDQVTFATFAERTEFDRPLMDGVAYATRVTHAERELFERQQGWKIKMMNSSKGSPMVFKRSPAEEYAPVIFAQDAYKHMVSFDMLTGTDHRDNVHRARESGNGVLTAPFKLDNNHMGVVLTYPVYKSELPRNATLEQRIHSAIGYLGGIFDIEALVDKLLNHQFAGSIMVKVYDTTDGIPITLYGLNSNDAGSDMSHISTLNFGDPSRNHEMHCRFSVMPPWPWLAITSSSGTLVIALLVGYIIHASFKWISQVEDGYYKSMPVLKRGEAVEKGMNACVSKPFEGELDQDKIDCGAGGVGAESSSEGAAAVQHKLRETERNCEELGKRSKFVTKVEKLASASIHGLPSRIRYLNKTVVSVGLLGLAIYILVIGTFDLPLFNQSLGIRSGDDNMMSSHFGRPRGRSLVATLHGTRVNGGVHNGDMISVDLSKMQVNSDRSGQQKHWSSHNSSEIIPLPAHKSHKITVRHWIALVSGISTVVLGIALWILMWCKRQKRGPQSELELLGGIGRRRFQVHELAAATSNFKDENKLGQGGFGPVYKGYLIDQDRHVAIKVLSKKQSSQEQSDQGFREFMAEVKVMTQLRHRNIVKLVGWCNSNKQLLLVYELMAQGSLDKHLYNPVIILTWQQRYKIALDLGSALLYLHRDCEKCIVHGDIKPANVMLDMSLNSKLGDFGLARLVEHGEEPQTTQVVAGTPGYIDPDFINNGRPRPESDVYSFGVVLLEIACGKRPASRQPNGASSLLACVRNLYDRGTILDAADQRLNGEFDQQQMERVLVTGLWCAHQDPIQRPSIVQAMDVLRSADAELPVLPAYPAAPDARRIRSMEEHAYGELPVADRSVHGGAPSTYFTSKDSGYLLAEE